MATTSDIHRSDRTRTVDTRGFVLTAQATASLGLAAGGAAGGLLALAISGDDATAAAPLGALVLGAGMSAPAAAAVMTRAGRLPGLVAGYVTGMLGAVLVLIAAAIGSLPLLLGGHVLFGAGNTAVMLSRYVVADLGPPERRGRAISTSMLTITLGAIIGPNLLGPTGRLAETVGLPSPAGLYVAALSAFLLAPAVLVASMRHVPAALTPSPVAVRSVVSAPAASPPTRGTAQVPALVVLTTANMTMVGVMAVAPVHLHAHGQGLSLVGLVVSLHVAAMYAASPVLGRINDRHGPFRLAAAGAVVFALAGITPLMIGSDTVPSVAGLLVLLGIGWNAQVVAGSAMLTRGVPLPLRPRFEGRGELSMSLAAAAGSLLLAGPLTAAGGITLLALMTIPLHVVVLWLIRDRLRPEVRTDLPDLRSRHGELRRVTDVAVAETFVQGVARRVVGIGEQEDVPATALERLRGQLRHQSAGEAAAPEGRWRVDRTEALARSRRPADSGETHDLAVNLPDPQR
jgi:MFS family permease